MMHIEVDKNETGWLHHNGHIFPLRPAQTEPDEVAHCQLCHVSFAGTGPTYSDPCPGGPAAPLAPLDQLVQQVRGACRRLEGTFCTNDVFSDGKRRGYSEPGWDFAAVCGVLRALDWSGDTVELQNVDSANVRYYRVRAGQEKPTLPREARGGVAALWGEAHKRLQERVETAERHAADLEATLRVLHGKDALSLAAELREAGAKIVEMDARAGELAQRLKAANERLDQLLERQWCKTVDDLLG